MKIASWNVNSLNVRMPHLAQWLREFQPDVVALQETKPEDARFPDTALAELGYRSLFCGQKTYNGVALLSRLPFDPECITAIPGFEDPQKRVLAAAVGDVRILLVHMQMHRHRDQPGAQHDRERHDVVTSRSIGDAEVID